MVINEINRAIELTDAISKDEPSRELSLTKTKLEEAVMWAEKAALLADLRRQGRLPQKSQGQRR
ncbi:MAG: hypothetical protein IT345_10560 [Trueperaceae bacterium]|nr:hypothetical protein [Trueperaceae bacterium]